MSKTRTALLLFFLALSLLLLPSQREGQALDAPARSTPTTLLVGLRGGENQDAPIERLLAAHGLRARRQIPRIGVWQVEATGGSEQALLAALRQDPDVLWAEPNGRVRASEVVPDDPYYQAQQAHLRRMGLPLAWLFATGDARPIAIIDSGVDLDHPDLAAKLWTNPGEVPGNDRDDDRNRYKDDVYGWDFVNGDATPQDDYSHGSHVAGIAAAHTDNGTGIAGVAPQSPIMALKALDNQGDGTWADVAEAIVYAADNGARVLNLSLGGTEYSDTIQAAVAYAQGRGCLVVAAAGNSDDQPAPVEYPAALPGVVAVAATTAEDEPAEFSNRGPEVDVAAPGVHIYSANKSGSYYLNSGTSPATPHVSGLAALVWSLRPAWTAAQVAGAITSTAHDVYLPGRDLRTGWGRVDAAAAVLQIVGPQVDLATDRSFVLAGGEGAALTAMVTTGEGGPAPDGFPVTFHADLGYVEPLSATTGGGQATATFTSTQLGQATVTARIAPNVQAIAPIAVVSGLLEINLAADRLFVLDGDPGAALTATVTYRQGGAPPDGLLVIFLTDLGHVEPPVAPTLGGQVTATFASTMPGQALVAARLAPDTWDTVALGVVLQPRVDLVADRSSLQAGREAATLTATVTISPGGAVPDGFPVAFTTTLGRVDPPSPLTHGGLVTATFTSSQCGQATVTARAGPVAQDAVAISLPCRLYLPAILRAY